MTYKQALKKIAQLEGITVKEVEQEMQKALNQSNINCTAKEFVCATANAIKKSKQTIYSR